MAFPENLTNAVDGVTEIVAAHLNNLEAKVGVDGSTVATSLDYLLKNPASINPGHKHSKLFASDGDPEAVTVDAAGKIGIHTTTIPHEGIGWAMVAIDGIDASPNGPHMQFTTEADNYPLFTILPYTHDNIRLIFDAYYDYGFKSSDLGSNFEIAKISDILAFRYASGVNPGNTITFNYGIVLNKSGNVGIGTYVFGTNAKKVLSIASGTAPTTSPSDMFQMWSADQAAGNACPHFRTENGAVLKLYQQAHIDDPSGGTTVDAEARTAINSILDLLENLGLMDAS